MLRRPATLPRVSPGAWALGIFAVALAARGAWSAYASADPFDGRLDDSPFYHFAARELAQGHGYLSLWSGGEPTALFPPGYPFFLGGLYFLFGVDPVVGEIANVILGAATAVLAFALATLLFGRRTGVLAGTLLALFPGQALFLPALMSEVLFTFLLLLALVLAVWLVRRRTQPDQSAPRPGLLAPAAVGLIAGLAALVRGEGMLIPLIAVPFWVAGFGAWKPALRASAIALPAMLALVLPWSVRNYLVMDSPILLSSNIGGNFFMARYADTLDRVAASEELMDPYSRAPLQEQEVKLNNRGWGEGVTLLVSQPQREFAIAKTKAKALYDADDDFLLHVEGFLSGKRLDEPLRNVLQRLANGYYFAVLSLAGLGLAVAWQGRRREALLPPALIAVWTVGQTVMLADTRYHFPIIPAFCLLAAMALAAAPEAASALVRNTRRIALSKQPQAPIPALETPPTLPYTMSLRGPIDDY